MLRCLFLLFFIVVAISCRHGTIPPGHKEKEEMRYVIRVTLERYFADIRKDGLTAEFKYLDTSDDFFWVPPGSNQALSYDSVVHVLENSAPLFKTIHNTWDSLFIYPLSSGLATYHGRISSVMTDTSGKVSTIRLIEAGLLIKREDGWKLLSGQTSIEVVQ